MRYNKTVPWKELAAVLLCGVVAACTKPTPPAPTTASAVPETIPGEPTDGDWLITRLSDEPDHLNPLTATSMYAWYIYSQIFDSLLDRDNETLDIIPKVAEEWTISDDHLTYTFKLRKDVLFTDGVPLTANDVKFTFDTVMAPTTDAARLRNYYQDVERCEVVDDYTVRFTCKKPYFKHLGMLGGLPILPKHIYGEGEFNTHPYNRKPLGSGPYVFEKWETGRQIVLVRNEQYWGKKPHILKRLYNVITDINAAFQVLERQELDEMELNPELWVNQAAKPSFEANFNKYQWYQADFSYIGWNMRLPQFKDKMVRRALTMLLDRKTILETIFYGLRRQVSGNFFIDSPEYDSSIEPWPFDPAQAKQLLDTAGWVDSDNDGVRDKDGVALKFELLIRAASPTTEQVATVYQEELKRAGIAMSIRPLEWATFIQSVQDRRFEAMMLGWGGSVVEQDPYQIWHSSQAEKGSNYVDFRNEEADKIMEKARLEFDEDKRVEMYHRFHAILHEEQPYTFLYCPMTLDAVAKRVYNVKIYPDGVDRIEWWVPTNLVRYQ